MASRAVDIKDKQSVQRWIERAERLNQRAESIVKSANDELKQLGNAAEGLFFNKVVSLADKILEGFIQIMQGVRKLCEVVNDVVDWGIQKGKELLEGVANTAKSILGGNS